MPTLTKRGSGTPVTSGTTWTTTTNAVDGTPPANPATYAVWTSSTSGATGYIEVSGYDFSTIPASAIINSVTVRFRHFESNTSRINTVTFQAYSGTTPLGSAASATKATAARDDSATFPVTLAQLQAANFKVRATAVRAAVTQSATFNVDLLDVTVDYSVEEKSGGSTGIINVPSDGAGVAGRQGGSNANVNTIESGGGFKIGAGGSTELIGVASEGGGSAGAAPQLSGGSEANVNVLDSGVGQKGVNWGATTFPKVDAEAGGFKKGIGGSTEFIGADGEAGTGTTTRRGGSEANVNVDASGTGVEKTSGGSTARVGADTEAAGRKAVSRGATTFPKVDGEAAGAKQSRSGSTEVIGVDAEGGGQAFVPTSGTGGSVARTGVDTEGSGRKATRGSSGANVGVDTEGAGTAFIPAIGVSGGSTTHPKVGADGAGRKTTTGSGEADIGIGADGTGRKAVARGSTSLLRVDTQGGGGVGVPEAPEGIILNNAFALYLGAQVVSSVYLGNSKVWPAPFDPLSLDGLAIWFDASQLGLADGASVSPWPNLGIGPTGTIIGTPAPVVRTNALNGLPVVRFAVNEGRLRMTGTGVDKDYTLVYVSRIYGYGGQRVVNANYPPSNLLFGYWYGNRDVAYSTPGFFTPNTQTPHTPPTYPWFLYSGDGASTPIYEPRFFKNGVLLGSGPGSTDGWMGYFNISGYQEPGTAETSECEIAELVLYNHKLTDADRQTVEQYLREKWGLA